VSLHDPAQWWRWTKAANWKQPQGPGSSIKGKEKHPVVHVSWEDAMAYCKWSGKRLPTEAEWEWAAKGGMPDAVYPWGSEQPGSRAARTNIWEGKFPSYNSAEDRFVRSAPVASFVANGYGLYDMAGNVWEWCSDWYHADYYKMIRQGNTVNPAGPAQSLDPMEPAIPKKVIKGGSFLCHASYCKGYRVSAKMKSSMDTGLEHTGFRCVLSN
jgi:formylglycine-generating enzyme required for sulfatase activity